MTGLTPRERPPGRIDPIAAAWGGLAASIGLMAGTGRDWPLRLVAAVLAFLVGGFLAGVRASARRPAHALLAAGVAYLLHAAYVMAARIIEVFGGPGAPPLAGGGALWALATLVALVAAGGGGALAGSWLRPAGSRRAQAPVRRSNSR